MRIDPLLTANPITGAVRYVTDDLLRETYLAPKSRDLDLLATLEGRKAPWSASFEAAPAETTRAVEAALTAVARSTQSLSPTELDVSALPECRAKTHLAALKELWKDMGSLPEPLAAWALAICSEANDALEPLPILDRLPCPHADAAEAALVEALTRQHGAAPEDIKDAARKLYVALTRARDRLILVLPKERRTARTQPERMIDILRDHAGLTVNDGEISLCGRAFEARIFDGNVESPDSTGIVENVGYALFGERRGLDLTGKTAWRRSPSTFGNQIEEPASHLATYNLGTSISDRALADPAARGTAWHLAFRVLVQHPDKANQLEAATGLSKDTLEEIEAQASALTSWLSDQGFDRLHFELPIQEVAADGSETNAIIDLLAEGQNGLLIVDHKSGACPDPETRFASYLPQLAAYAELIRKEWPDKQLKGIAINWMSEGTLSLSRVPQEALT